VTLKSHLGLEKQPRILNSVTVLTAAEMEYKRFKCNNIAHVYAVDGRGGYDFKAFQVTIPRNIMR